VEIIGGVIAVVLAGLALELLRRHAWARRSGSRPQQVEESRPVGGKRRMKR
jgi:hypothetical protein